MITGSFRFSLIVFTVVLFSAAPVIAQQSGARGRLKAPDLGGQPISDMVVAAIDGEPLTLSDLKAFVLARGEVPPQDVDAGKFDAGNYLREFVMQQLLEKEAKSSGIAVTEQEIHSYIEEIKRQNRTDDAGFEQLLKQKGLTLESYKKQIIADILKTRIVSTKLRSKVNVSDEDAERYAKDHPELLPKEGDLRVFQAFVPSLLPGDAQARETIDRIRSDIRDGKSFAQAAAVYYSDLGYVNAGDLLPELSEALSSLDAGEVSSVIESSKGYYLLQVSERKTGPAAKLSDEMREQVKKDLFDARLKEAVDVFLNDELPKKYSVEIKL